MLRESENLTSDIPSETYFSAYGGEPSPKSLVVARCEGRVVARRFEIADNHSDIAVLTAHAINPAHIAQPIVVKRTTIQLHKIVGVLFGHGQHFLSAEGEVKIVGVSPSSIAMRQRYGGLSKSSETAPSPSL